MLRRMRVCVDHEFHSTCSDLLEFRHAMENFRTRLVPGGSPRNPVADFVQTLLTQRLPEHPGYFGEMVWILMMLERWLAAKAPQFRLVD